MLSCGLYGGIICFSGGDSLDFFENLRIAEEMNLRFTSQSFVMKHGQGGIMFSAPHSVEQTREGRLKYAEPQTGVLAEMLHNELGCPIIRKTANCGDDANYDPVSDYRETLARYIRDNRINCLIDLHQLSPSREVMINLGTGNGENLCDKSVINIFLSTFHKYNLGIIQLDKPFSAAYKYTVSSAIHRECNISCMQIEINSKLVLSEYKECSLESVYRSLYECFIKLREFYT